MDMSSSYFWWKITFDWFVPRVYYYLDKYFCREIYIFK